MKSTEGNSFRKAALLRRSKYSSTLADVMLSSGVMLSSDVMFSFDIKLSSDVMLSSDDKLSCDVMARVTFVAVLWLWLSISRDSVKLRKSKNE